MGFFSSPIKTMDDLYSHTLQDIFYAEHQITKALPKMIDKASNPALKQAFQKHLGETQQQVKRLEEVFKILGKDAKGVTCPAIDGIIKEAHELISDCDDHKVRDAAMLAAAQAVEHYEMTRYGTLIAWSEQLGKQKVVRASSTKTLNGGEGDRREADPDRRELTSTRRPPDPLGLVGTRTERRLRPPFRVAAMPFNQLSGDVPLSLHRKPVVGQFSLGPNRKGRFQRTAWDANVGCTTALDPAQAFRFSASRQPALAS